MSEYTGGTPPERRLTEETYLELRHATSNLFRYGIFAQKNMTMLHRVIFGRYDIGFRQTNDLRNQPNFVYSGSMFESGNGAHAMYAVWNRMEGLRVDAFMTENGSVEPVSIVQSSMLDTTTGQLTGLPVAKETLVTSVDGRAYLAGIYSHGQRKVPFYEISESMAQAHIALFNFAMKSIHREL